MKIAGTMSGHSLDTTHFYINPYSSPLSRLCYYPHSTEKQQSLRKVFGQGHTARM